MSALGFSSEVIQWFESHGRKDLPWQRDPSAYRVWISEVMLQQTQVATVIPYFERFMVSFPDIAALAAANIDDVLHHWSGLGYYARARNLHKAARVIAEQLNGDFPAVFEEVLALPGIGRSTAGAILALSGNERHAILDGNVKRVLARYHGVTGWPGNTSVARSLWQLAEDHTPDKRVAEYTQAMMDLGATVCRRTKPLCGACPIADNCNAHAIGRETDYPGRRPKLRKPLKKTFMLLVHDDAEVYLERRPAAGIWGGLWSFPQINGIDELVGWCERQLGGSPANIERWQIVRHSFTHFDLEIEPIAVRVQRAYDRVADGDAHVWYNLSAPQMLGLAAPVSRLLEKLERAEKLCPEWLIASC